jgi:hypothetical protein
MRNWRIEAISNSELRIKDVPAPSARWDRIQQFALTFDGYKRWGSFEKTAAIANARLSRTLTELRTCLFFEQRRWRWAEERPDRNTMRYIRDILVEIRKRLATKAPRRRWQSKASNR